MSERKKLICSLAALIGMGTCYYIFLRITGWGIPCIFRKITGFLCPGCGITRMCMAIITGDFISAYKANPCIFIMMPVWIVIIAIKLIFQPVCLKTDSRFFNILLWITLIILLAFGVLRNINI